jgi:predicted RNase H-like nuclease (RuvC/YqgF family)
MADNDEEVRRLRGEVHRLREDNAALEQRLGYAWRQVEELRSRLLEGKRTLQTAEPVDRQHGALVSVTAAELEAALARLAQVKPLPLA